MVFQGCDGYLAGPVSINHGFVKPNVLFSPVALTSVKSKTMIRELKRADKASRSVKRSYLSIKMSEKNDNGDEEESLLQKTMNVLSTPITLPIPAFIASLVLGSVTITFGIFYSVYLTLTVPDVSASAQIIPESTSTTSTITKDELTEGQRDSIIFNEILSGIAI